MKQLLTILFACLALGLAVAGCGGDDDDGGSDGGAAATTEQTSTADRATGGQEAGGGEQRQAGGGQVEIEVVDIDYDPREETIDAGTTVRWTNTGDLPHTVTKEEGPGADFDSGTLQPGETFEQTFDTPGEIAYLCTIHSGQDGSLTVR